MQLSHEFVRDFFKENGCQLLDKYVRANMPVRYICECGSKATIRYMKFRQGQRCRKCGKQKAGNARRKNLDQVKTYFFKHDCKLLATEYKNNKAEMPYICSCGKKSVISWKAFRKGVRCVECSRKKMSQNCVLRKYDLAAAKKAFKKGGCVLLAKEYVNSNIPMPYVCECGRRATISLSSFNCGTRCMKCRSDGISKRFKKHTLDSVQKIFSDQKCKLLAKKYISTQTPMSYICECGNKSKVRLSNFLNGNRCRECSKIRTGDALRTPFETVRAAFAKVGLKLLSTTYMNHDQLLWYECQKCHAVRQTQYRTVSRGHGCKICSVEKIHDRRRHTHEFARLFFLKMGLQLTAQVYKNSQQSLGYCCLRCGNIGSTSLASLMRQNSGCGRCGAEKRKQTKKFYDDCDFDMDIGQLFADIRGTNGC